MKSYLMAIIFLMSVLVSQPALTGYNAEVTKIPDWATTAGRIAIAPAACPSDFDCVWLNETMAEYVGIEGYPFTAGPKQVSQAMLEAGVVSLDGEGALKVAEILGVDSFLVVAVGNAETKIAGAVAVPMTGGGFIMAPSQRAQGGIEIRVVTAQGRTLAQGSGFGESGLRRGRGVIGKVFGNLVDELVFN